MPSQVVAVIDEMFPTAQQLPDHTSGLNTGQFNQLQSIIRLIDKIPSQLMSMPVGHYADMLLAVSTLEVNYQHWISRGGNFGLPRVKGKNPIAIIRDVLSECPDEFPPVETTDLLFVSDVGLRENIRSDIGAINRSLASGEWKSANVLAGAAIEALLLWRLQEEAADQLEALAAKMVASGYDRKIAKQPLDQWTLDAMIEAAAQLGAIEPQTVVEATLCRSYRNLIHPGRSIRLGVVCDRGTAFSAVGALEHVIRDLSR